jgi:putative aldouronate transport system permease protein
VRVKKTVGERIFIAVDHVYLILVSLLMFIPFWLILTVSFSSESAIAADGYGLWFREFSLEAYRFVFEKGTVFRAYGVTLFVTAAGTFAAVLITSMIGYAASRRYFKYRNAITFIVYFTMLFSGGLVPWYIQVSRLGIKDTVWALILPMVFTPWYMFLVRNYMQTLPDALTESAKLDGAGEYRVFFQIMLPLALPGLATITLFYMLAFWNDWWLALNFINDTALYPLQFLLRQVLSNIIYITSGRDVSPGVASSIPAETVKMATCVLTIGPIVFVYPFIQKYFIKGITVGAIK